MTRDFVCFIIAYTAYDEFVLQCTGAPTTTMAIDARLRNVLGELQHRPRRRQQQRRGDIDDDDFVERDDGMRRFVSRRDANDASESAARYRFAADDERSVARAHVTLRCVDGVSLAAARRRLLRSFDASFSSSATASVRATAIATTPTALLYVQRQCRALRVEIELWRRALSSALRAGRDVAARSTSRTLSLMK